MISKGSRYGVGSLICVRVSDDLRTVSGVPTSFYWYPPHKTPLKCQHCSYIVLRPIGINDPFFVASFQKGDEAALTGFYNAFHPALALYSSRWVKNRQIAEEIASEGIFKTWMHRVQLDSVEGIRGYLYKTVLRDSLLCQKRELRRSEVHQLGNHNSDTVDTPFDHTVRCETYRLIHLAMKELSPGNFKVLRMHFLEGKSTGEIARELNLSPTTVKTQKARGLQALRDKIPKPPTLLFYLIVKILLPFL